MITSAPRNILMVDSLSFRILRTDLRFNSVTPLRCNYGADNLTLNVMEAGVGVKERITLYIK